jgi:hypothetical protein|tara:strand:+ start:4809 stop:5726 length:918 start_codon:yes stop_codon:yes gene_type:complete
MSSQLDIPILIIVFNRPELTKKLINSLKSLKPLKIYVAADGPRNENDIYLCKETKTILESEIDWKCTLVKRYQTSNLGVKNNVCQAIDWFFINEEKGIILEDDCEVNFSFFKFCKELLIKYEQNNRIKVISGNFYFKNYFKNTYYFSRLPGTHGWASWRRAWKEYDINMEKWSPYKDFIWLLIFFKLNIVKAHYFYKKFQLSKNSQIVSWDYQFLYSIWKNNGLIIKPFVNLSKHIGWGDDATHGKGSDRHPEIIAEEIDFPLIHPLKIKENSKLDNLEIKKIRKLYFFSYIGSKILNKITNFLK